MDLTERGQKALRLKAQGFLAQTLRVLTRLNKCAILFRASFLYLQN